MFNVRVPVLSEQITVAFPSVSTAGRFLIKACSLAIRCTPSAIMMVAVAGSPSGMIEIAKEIATKNCGRRGRP